MARPIALADRRASSFAALLRVFPSLELADLVALHFSGKVDLILYRNRYFIYPTCPLLRRHRRRGEIKTRDVILVGSCFTLDALARQALRSFCIASPEPSKVFFSFPRCVGLYLRQIAIRAEQQLIEALCQGNENFYRFLRT